MKTGIFVLALMASVIFVKSSFCQIQFEPHTIAGAELAADGARSVFAIDVDGDEDIDVISASWADDKIAWYENNGAEHFIAHTISASADAARSVFAIDLDGDEDIDVLSASFNDDKIAWYENDGSENFFVHNITTSANGAWSVFAIDIDGDEDIDVLSASRSDDKIAWYENDGFERFSAHIITTEANGAESVFAIDIDGDEDIDVLSASYYDDKIAWYENLGGSGPNVSVSLTPFNPPIQIPAGGGSFQFNIAVANAGTTLVNSDIWTIVILPGGNEYGPIINVNYPLPAGFNTDRDRIQAVPVGAPPGTYIYEGFIGVYPDSVWDDDSFEFEKLTVEDNK